MSKKKKRIASQSGVADKEGLKRPGIFNTHIYVLCFCVFSTFAVYIYSSLHNQFTNWDDGLYVINNTVIKSWNTGLFTTSVDGNWAPVHLLLLAVEYHLFGINPAGYHFTSLLLHLCNVALVFVTVFKLSRKLVVAGIAALFFGIHPMHVESVAWVSEQKDLLYTLFYLAAMFTYIKYKEYRAEPGHSGYRYLLLTALLFILSCLSKGMGVTLPVALVLIDSLEENNYNWKFLAQSAVRKIVFFTISIGFGIGAVVTQKHAGNLNDIRYHALGDQMMFACYGLMVYVAKFVLPFSLSPLYPYPIKDSSGMYPIIYSLSPIIVALAAGILLWVITRRKKQGQSNNILFFGLLFFFANIILVLQLKAVGHVILAERYTYLSYFGLLFIAAQALNNFWEKHIYQYKNAMIAGGCLLTIIFGASSYTDTSIWNNSVTLWTQAIDKFGSTPMEAMEMAYINRGIVYAGEGKPDSAMADYSAAISLNPKFAEAYNNRGLAYANMGKPDLALADYNSAIALNPTYFSAYYNRGLAYTSEGKPELAIADYTKAVSLNSQFVMTYYNRGLTYAALGKFDMAVADYTTAVTLDPKLATAYNSRGLAYEKLGKPEQALGDYNAAIALNPQYAEAYYNLGLLYARQGKFELTIAENTTAISLNPQYYQAYNNRGLAYANMGKPDLAIADYDMVIKLNPMYGQGYYNRGLEEERKGNHAQAQMDMEKAKTLGQNSN